MSQEDGNISDEGDICDGGEDGFLDDGADLLDLGADVLYEDAGEGFSADRDHSDLGADDGDPNHSDEDSGEGPFSDDYAEGDLDFSDGFSGDGAEEGDPLDFGRDGSEEDAGEGCICSADRDLSDNGDLDLEDSGEGQFSDDHAEGLRPQYWCRWWESLRW